MTVHFDYVSLEQRILASMGETYGDLFQEFISGFQKTTPSSGPPAPWWERLATVGVEDSDMTATRYVRKYAHKMRGRKNRRLRALVRRAAMRMDRIVRRSVKPHAVKGAQVKVYRDGTILGFPVEGVTQSVRFRSL